MIPLVSSLDDLLSTKFELGGRVPGSRIDCLGVVLVVLAFHGKDVSDPYADMRREFRGGRIAAERDPQWRLVDSPYEVDDVFILPDTKRGTPTHLAIMSEDGWVMQSTEGAMGVVRTRFEVVAPRIIKAYRWSPT